MSQQSWQANAASGRGQIKPDGNGVAPGFPGSAVAPKEAIRPGWRPRSGPSFPRPPASQGGPPAGVPAQPGAGPAQAPGPRLRPAAPPQWQRPPVQQAPSRPNGHAAVQSQPGPSHGAASSAGNQGSNRMGPPQAGGFRPPPSMPGQPGPRNPLHQGAPPQAQAAPRPGPPHLPHIRTQAAGPPSFQRPQGPPPLMQASTSQPSGAPGFPVPHQPGQGQRPLGMPQRPLAPVPQLAQHGQLRGATQPDRQSQGTSRIDPASMPRPLPRPEEPQDFPTRQDGKPMLPLPADHPIIIVDAGNCSPRNMRLTLNCVPSTSDMVQQSGMPLAVLVQPLAPTQPGEEPLQVVDMGEGGPLRCTSCRAYVNPFMQFTDYGRKFVCNFCGATCQTPHDYIENVGADGRRRDADERPELCRGSVEFVATRQFMVRPPMPPTHFFLIDVTHTAVSSGATAVACDSILRILDDIQGGDRAKIGIATFDSTVHFYALRSSQSQPQMLVVPDADEPYCPQPESLLVRLRESRSLVDALLQQIPGMFAESRVLDSCGSAAIDAAIQALKGGVGGKLHAFLSCLPKVGARALAVREQGGKTNEKEALKVMEPATKDYRQLAEAAAEAMISIDLFLAAQSFVDVATLGTLPRVTAGQLYLYQPFSPAAHADELYNDLRWNVVRPQGWEAVGRLRASEGLVVERYFGPLHRRTMTDVDLAAVHADTSIAVELRHSDRLADTREAYLQFALVFTDCEGRRRIRVHTLGLPVTSVMGTVFRGADVDSQINFLGRRLAFQVPGSSLAAVKEQAYKNAVDVLYTYRSKCASASASGQLILPESLKLLPLYALALTKTHAFRSNAKADLRAAWLLRLLCLPPARTLPLVYPRLFALGGLLADLPPEPSQLRLPPAILYLSASKLADTGIFLLENGFEAFLQFGERVPAELMLAILGVPALESMASPTQLVSLPVLDTPPSRALHALADIVRQQRGRFLPLLVMPNVPAYMSPFYTSLVEDKVEGASYVEHLCAVHRDIQRKFS